MLSVPVATPWLRNAARSATRRWSIARFVRERVFLVAIGLSFVPFSTTPFCGGDPGARPGGAVHPRAETSACVPRAADGRAADPTTCVPGGICDNVDRSRQRHRDAAVRGNARVHGAGTRGRRAAAGGPLGERAPGARRRVAPQAGGALSAVGDHGERDRRQSTHPPHRRGYSRAHRAHRDVGDRRDGDLVRGDILVHRRRARRVHGAAGGRRDPCRRSPLSPDAPRLRRADREPRRRDGVADRAAACRGRHGAPASSRHAHGRRADHERGRRVRHPSARTGARLRLRDVLSDEGPRLPGRRARGRRP
jgi:hypothetical protein